MNDKPATLSRFYDPERYWEYAYDAQKRIVIDVESWGANRVWKECLTQGNVERMLEMIACYGLLPWPGEYRWHLDNHPKTFTRNPQLIIADIMTYTYWQDREKADYAYALFVLTEYLEGRQSLSDLLHAAKLRKKLEQV